jgi:Dipeptide/tripeptide permease
MLTAQGRVSFWWLVGLYFLEVCGEMCLSPVGLSAVTKLAPARLVGQLMGIWFLGTSLGNLLAGLLAGDVTGENLAAMPPRLLQVALAAGVTGIVLLCLAKPFNRLTAGIQ